MNVFEAVKQSVTTRQAAEHFGIRVGRNGMCVCPFHDDKNPSMKVDRRFHCFGCQADGDVIDFVSRLEAVSPKEAALMLAQAFSIPYEDKEPPSHQRNPGRKPRNSNSSAWSVTASGCCVTITICCAAGNGTMPPRRRRRISTRSLWKPCRSNPMWNICWMCCCSPDMEERAALIIDCGKEVRNLERRMAELAAGDAAGRRTDTMGSSTAAPER